MRLKVVTNLSDTPKDSCTIFLSTMTHTHQQGIGELQSERGIDLAVKDLIAAYDSQNIPPRGMLPLIRIQGFNPPTLTKIYTLLKKLRNGQVESTTQIWTLEQLAEFAKKRSNIPEDEDELFVPAYTVTPLPESRFQIFMTTKRLIKFARWVNL